MKRFGLSTLMLLVVIGAQGVALVLAARREAELQARLAKSWPLFLKQQREDQQIRSMVEAIQRRYPQELAKKSAAEARRQEQEDAQVNRQVDELQQRFRAEQAKAELAK
jgi:hypothetical protein